MDVETFINQIKGALIDLIAKELKTRNSAKIQTTTWIRFAKGPMDPESGDVDRINNNNKKRSHTQLDSRKQVIAFQDRVSLTA